MRISKILSAGLVGLFAGLMSQVAYADIMTATWTGTIFQNQPGANNPGVAVGTIVNMSFTYDTSALGPYYIHSSSISEWLNYESAGYAYNDFSEVTYAFGSYSGSYDIPALPNEETILAVGGPTEDDFYNYVRPGIPILAAGLNDNGQPLLGFLTGDPTQQFDFTLPNGYGGQMTFVSDAGTFVANVTNLTVVDDSLLPVPAPGALALFGLGVAGLEAMRRRRVA